MENTPQYYRARLKAIFDVAKQNPPDRFKKNTGPALLRYGVIHAEMEKPVNEIIENNVKDQSSDPLRFSEITRFNTWFEIHPEKVCGVEVTMHFYLR